MDCWPSLSLDVDEYCPAPLEVDAPGEVPPVEVVGLNNGESNVGNFFRPPPLGLEKEEDDKTFIIGYEHIEIVF